MFDSDALFDDGTTAIVADGYGAGSAVQTGPGTFTIEVIATAVVGSGSDKITVRESADDSTYNDLAVFENLTDEGVVARMNVTTEKEYLKLYHDLTGITSIKVVAGIVAAHGGGV